MMAGAVYILCAVMSLTCSILLIKGYSQNKFRLLFWSSIGFLGFALNNILLFVDLILIPGYDLTVLRTLPALAGMILLIHGLITDSNQELAMYELLSGALMMACLVAAFFFLEFWRRSRDKLFLMFSVAFFILSLERLVLGSLGTSHEPRPTIYLIRLTAFVIILIAIIHKNREKSPSQ